MDLLYQHFEKNASLFQITDNYYQTIMEVFKLDRKLNVKIILIKER